MEPDLIARIHKQLCFFLCFFFITVWFKCCQKKNKTSKNFEKQNPQTVYLGKQVTCRIKQQSKDHSGPRFSPVYQTEIPIQVKMEHKST